VLLAPPVLAKPRHPERRSLFRRTIALLVSA
jgi:hypothetical protein